MTIGERIKAIRCKNGMTQSELASKLGIAYQNIGQWERGITTPKLETLYKISNALNCSLVELGGEITFGSWDESDGLPMGKRAAENYVKGELVTVPAGTNVAKILKPFYELNSTGQQRAVSAVEDLAKVPEYQRTDKLSAND